MTNRIVYASDIIDCQIRSLHALLTEAQKLAATACEHLRDNELQAAVGTIVPIEDLLMAATAMHATILFLHRQRG